MNGAAFLEEIRKTPAARVPGVKLELRQKRGGYTEDDPELWAEIKAKDALAIMAIGHCSTCAPAVAVHCMTLERMGIPTAPLVTEAFRDLVKAVAFKAGTPDLRFTFVPHPVAGKSKDVLKKYSQDSLQAIIRALTSPLTADERHSGEEQRPVPRLLGANSEDELHVVVIEYRGLGVRRFLAVVVDEMPARRKHSRRQLLLAQPPPCDIHLMDALVADVAVPEIPVPVPVVMEAVLLPRFVGRRSEPDVVFHPGGRLGRKR